MGGESTCAESRCCAAETRRPLKPKKKKESKREHLEFASERPYRTP